MPNNRSSRLPNPADFANEAAGIVIAAGAMLRAEFHRPGGPRGSGSKAPIDQEIERFLRAELLKLNPCDWRGEELPHETTGHPDIWIVDPNDGTRAFLRGLRGSAISVALIRHGEPVLGIVYAPTAPDDAGDLFLWAEGMPPIRNGNVLAPIGSNHTDYQLSADEAGRAVEAASGVFSKRYDADTVIGLNEEAGDYAATNHERAFPASILAIPSIAYRLALAAAGEVDVAVSLTSGLDAYDIAGGCALLKAVGGEAFQADGNLIRFDGSLTYHGCIAGRPELIPEVLKRKLGGGQRVKRNPAYPSNRTSSSFALRGAQGTLLGQLAGDALGSYVEFQSPDQISRSCPEGVTSLKPGGTWNLIPGQPTDDSEMALALARVIAQTRSFDAEMVAEAYVGWGNSKPFDIGTTTRTGLKALAGHGRHNNESQANGALMRVSPIGIYAAGQPALAAELARQDAALTHPNPVCVEASAAFAAAISAGIAGADHRTMWSVAHGQANSGEVQAALEQSLRQRDMNFLQNQGWVLLALENAFRRLWLCQPLEAALIETVASGGDTDTNAAICGALLGAAQGREAIPLQWRRKVLSCRSVKGTGVTHSRPSFYWPDDALELAEALLVARQKP